LLLTLWSAVSCFLFCPCEEARSQDETRRLPASCVVV